MAGHNQKHKGTLKELLKTSIPAVIDLTGQPMVWIYEAFLLGQISYAALGGAGLAFQFIVVTLTVVLTFVIGSSLIINRHLGAGESWKANHIFGQAMMLGAVLSVIIGIVWYVGAPWIFKIINESEPVGKVYGIQYLQTIALFAPIVIVCYIALGIIRSTGDSHFSLLINLIIIGVNVLLAPLLAFGEFGFPRLEVVGLAMSKGIAFTVGFFITAYLVRSRRAKLFLSMREMTTPNWGSVKKLFKIGFPSTVEQLTWYSGQLIVSGYAARLGLVVLTTHQVLLLLQAVMSMIYQGFSLGSMTLVGKNVGADDHRQAERTGYIASGLILFAVLLIVWFVYSFSLEILQIFTKDQEVLDLGLKVIFVFALVQIPKALNTVLMGNLRGAGELKWIMWVTIASVLVFEVTASYAVVFIFNFTLVGIWGVHGFDEFSRFLFNFVRFRTGKWKTQEI